MKPNHLIENGYVWLDDRARESVRLMARLISRHRWPGEKANGCASYLPATATKLNSIRRMPATSISTITTT